MRLLPRLLAILLFVASASLVVVACVEEVEDAENAEFSNLRTEEIGPDRAVLRFTTSVETTCAVLWGTDPDGLVNEARDPNMAAGERSFEHEVPLEDLEPDRTYYWRANVRLADGTGAISVVNQFKTLPADGQVGRQNVALQSAGATIAEVSSNFGGEDNASTFGANNAIDGQMGTEWSSDGDGDDAFLVIDLGQAQELSAFGFRSREMADGTAVIESVQLVLDDGTTTLGPFETPNPDEHYLFELDPTVSAQRVRVEAVTTTGGNTGAREIELYGTP